ncbi:hypothetical protein [Aquifex aeolicus]|uniref:Uncharacterized protein aq_aa23 n=1 Tax=Aquifex aeolicus (strain VF5) TaxID=224324 RepID=YZ23_AQUAE|nr:hypothetical protein [Aquifex aeolicus]O66414.1 RecName: Full=Uncharacterized protein aq_aa23 [Aquifex aeolicus VF5]AAC07966.1 putative protein [Aquifex aeolicus VF5]
MNSKELTKEVLNLFQTLPEFYFEHFHEYGIWFPIVVGIIASAVGMFGMLLFYAAEPDTEFEKLPFFVRKIASREGDEDTYFALGIYPIIILPAEGKIIKAAAIHEFFHVLFKFPWVIFQPVTGIFMTQLPYRFFNMLTQFLYTVLPKHIVLMLILLSMPILKKFGMEKSQVYELLSLASKYITFVYICALAAVIEELLVNIATAIYFLITFKFNENTFLVTVGSSLTYLSNIPMIFACMWMDFHYADGQGVEMAKKFIELVFKTELSSLFF